MTTLTAAAAADLFRTPPHRYIDVQAGEVAYRRVGTGPDLLFVHGWPVNSATYRALLPHLAPHFTCHLIDLPGAGHSRFDRSTTLTVTQHVRSVQRVVDALGLERFAAIGHDSGGLIARHALAGDPRLRAMALVNTEQPQGLNWRFRQFLMMAKLPGFERLLGWAVMRPRLRRSPLLLGDCFCDRSLLGGEFEELLLAPLNRDPLRRWAADQLVSSFDTRYVDQLAEVHARMDIPVQLIWGEHDPFFPLEWAREMVESFPNASLQVIPQAKLFVHEERPAAVAEAIVTGVRAAILAEEPRTGIHAA